MGAIYSNTVGLYNNNEKKFRNMHQQKTLNPNLKLSPRFYQVKLENYSMHIMPNNNSSHKVKT